MKRINVFLMVVLILLIAFTVYFFIGGRLQADVTTITANAADYPDAFESILNVLSSGSAPQRFSGEVPSSAEDWTLVDTTVMLSNRGLFAAEWIDISVEAAPGDLAVYSLSGEGTDVRAQSSARVNLKLITTAPADAQRDITLTYYVYGMRRTLTVTG